MAEPGSTELNNVSNSYESLVEKYPADKVILVDKPVTQEERKWAESFLSVGDNNQVLENFAKYSGLVGKKGLQLLRNSSARLTSELEDKLKQNIKQDVLLDYFRSKFQADTLFFEEGLRGARDIDNKYWNDEEDGQLDSARKRLKKSKAAFREMNDFIQGKTNKLSSVRVFIESNYKAQENATINNENYYRQRIDITNPKGAEEAFDQDAKEAIFWTSAGSFVGNLELSKQ